jgi:hypothetical protein
MAGLEAYQSEFHELAGPTRTSAQISDGPRVSGHAGGPADHRCVRRRRPCNVTRARCAFDILAATNKMHSYRVQRRLEG